MALQADETIVGGRYRVVRQIGEGGQARVWLAEDLLRNLQVAIKEPAPDLTGSQIADQADRYRRELRYSGALFQAEVPNTVRVITVEEWEGIPLLVMEYCGGGSLKDRLARDGALPIAEAVQISLDLLAALSVVHEKLGWVHRDIKPANVLFTAEGRTRLADFGLAQTMESGRSLTSQPHPGTPAYMAPEQEATRGYLPPVTDLYTVGCLLFEMLTGTLYKRVRPGTAAGSLRPDVPVWLDAVLAKALQDDIWNRYESAIAMSAALRQLPPAAQPAAGVVAAGLAPAARGAEGGLAQPLAAGRAFSAYPAGRRGKPSAHPRALVPVIIVVAAAVLLLAIAVSQMQERQRHAAATATAETRWTATAQALATSTADALRTATRVAGATATEVAGRTATQGAAAGAPVAVVPLPSAATPATTNTPRPTDTPQPPATPLPTDTPVPPEVIVDELGPSFEKGASWHEVAGGDGGHFFWTYSSKSVRVNWARWRPALPMGGRYEVSAFIPDFATKSSNARYMVTHSGRSDAVAVDQSWYMDEWASIGTFAFSASGQEFVYLDDITGEANFARRLVYDAVRFQYRGP